MCTSPTGCPVEPEDCDEIEVGFAHVGALSRLHRFRVPVEHLSARRLTELMDVDHDKEALVALTARAGVRPEPRWLQTRRNVDRATVGSCRSPGALGEAATVWWGPLSSGTE